MQYRAKPISLPTRDTAGAINDAIDVVYCGKLRPDVVPSAEFAFKLVLRTGFNIGDKYLGAMLQEANMPRGFAHESDLTQVMGGLAPLEAAIGIAEELG